MIPIWNKKLSRTINFPRTYCIFIPSNNTLLIKFFKINKRTSRVFGDSETTYTLDPAEFPVIVMSIGFSPNSAMLSTTHLRPIAWSQRPRFPAKFDCPFDEKPEVCLVKKREKVKKC